MSDRNRIQDNRMAGNVRHMLGIDGLTEIPQSLIDEVVQIQHLLKPFGANLDIRNLAQLVVGWKRNNPNPLMADWHDMEPGTPLSLVTVEGEEDVEFVRKPGGKHIDKVHVRTADMDEGKYRVVDKSDLRQPEMV